VGKDFVEAGMLQMTIWRMCIACWIPKAKDTHSEYVIRNALTLQKYLHERASMLRYTYIACLEMYWVCALVIIGSIVKHTAEGKYFKDLTGLLREITNQCI
jgi:hypothetical protein